eukprot:2623080-Amphidinium_carterae.1
MTSARKSGSMLTGQCVANSMAWVTILPSTLASMQFTRESQLKRDAHTASVKMFSSLNRGEAFLCALLLWRILLLVGHSLLAATHLSQCRLQHSLPHLSSTCAAVPLRSVGALIVLDSFCSACSTAKILRAFGPSWFQSPFVASLLCAEA